MRFQILGPLEVTSDGTPVHIAEPRQRKVLALLLIDVGRSVSVERLVDALWDGDPPATARRQVQNAVAAVRRALAAVGDDPIDRIGSSYRLTSTDVDLLDFRAAVAEARALADEPAAAVNVLSRALALWRGTALGDVPGDACDAAGRRLDESRLDAVDALAEARLAIGDNTAVVDAARHVLDGNPYRQRTAANLMLALYRDRRAADALDVYGALRRRLADDLGMDPDAALQDLHRSVLAADPDLAEPDGAASPAPRPIVPAQLPAAVHGFAGRDVERARLDELADAPADRLRIAVVSGSAGVGKTALAVEWAHRVRDRFPDGQFHVDMRGFHPDGTVTDPMDALHGFLTALGVASSSIPSDPDARIAAYRSVMADRSMLILLDNVRDADQVRPLLPGSPTGLVLVTSRRNLPALVIRHGARHMPLSTFDDDAARHLLTRRLGASAAVADPVAVDRIVTACAGLPLSLAIAAGRAAMRPDSPLRELADELGDEAARLDALSTVDVDGGARAVLSWSYHALSPDAALLFRLVGLHPGPDVTIPAVASLAGVAVDAVVGPLRELVAANVVTEHRRGRFRLHDLLWSYARELAAREDGTEAGIEATRRLLDHYATSAMNAAIAFNGFLEPIALPEPASGASAETFTDPGAAADWLTTEQDTVVGLMRLAHGDGFDCHVVGLCRSIGGFLLRRAHCDVGVTTQRLALESARRLGDRELQIILHTGAGAFLSRGGRAEEAEDHFRSARELCDPEKDRLLLARAHHQSVILFDEVGRLDEALDHCTTALRLFVETGDRHGAAKSLNGVGWLYARLGRFDEALDACERALSESVEIGDHTLRSATLHSIAYVMWRSARYSEALEHVGEAIRAAKDQGFRLIEAQAMALGGDISRSTGDERSARRLWTEAVAIYREIGDEAADRVEAKLRGDAVAGEA